MFLVFLPLINKTQFLLLYHVYAIEKWYCRFRLRCFAWDTEQIVDNKFISFLSISLSLTHSLSLQSPLLSVLYHNNIFSFSNFRLNWNVIQSVEEAAASFVTRQSTLMMEWTKRNILHLKKIKKKEWNEIFVHSAFSLVSTIIIITSLWRRENKKKRKKRERACWKLFHHNFQRNIIEGLINY